MADAFLTGIVETLLDVVRPVERSLVSADSFGTLMLRTGWTPPADPSFVDGVRAALDLSTKIESVATALDDVVVDQDASPEELLQLVASAAVVVDDVVKLAQAPAGMKAPPLDSDAFWQDFARQLASGLFGDYLRLQRPGLYAPLHLLGVVEHTFVPGAGQPYRVDHYETTLHWDRLPTLLTDPGSLARRVYGWGGAFDYAELLTRLDRALGAYGVPSGIRTSHSPLLSRYYAQPTAVPELDVPLVVDNDPSFGWIEVGASVLPIPPEPIPSSAAPSGVAIGPYVRGAAATSVPLGGPLSLQLRGGLDSTDPVALEIRPTGIGAVLTGAGTEFDAAAAIVVQPAAPLVLIGAEEASHVALGSASAGLELSGPVASPELALALRVTQLAVVLDFSQGDGFLTRVFGDEQQRVEGSGALLWSSKRGLTFEGEAALELTLPLNKSIGPVDLRSLTIAIDARSGGPLALVAAITGDATLGPIAASVEKVGVALELEEKPSGGGAFGTLDLGFGFKPPTGAGLSIDSSAVTGGGFLAFDEAKHEYAGAVHLDFEGIALNAFGLITTGGAQGFSLLVIVNASGFTPIQLGFGFALTGVGGLLGVNRDVAIEPLRAAQQSHALDAILFTTDDPTPRAPQIVAALETIFPPAPSRYVFGPMAEIIWGGEARLLTIDVAVLLQLPSPVRLIVLGRLHSSLPTESEGIVRLNMDVLGVLDFDARTVAVDATLYDSKIVEFALTGKMALRAGWGATPGFALSVGGFHPQFTPPPGFPQLERLAISLSSSDNPKLRLEAYLALTSNTVQFGARLDVAAHAGPFGIQGLLAFDALIHLAPFGLLTEIQAMVAFTADGSVLMSVSLDIMLSGPTPWHARGKATIHILFFSASVSFDATFGGGQPAPLPAGIDIWGAHLLPALGDPANWAAQLPADGQVARLAAQPVQSGVLGHPAAALVVRQRVVPLDRKVDWFGSAPPKLERRFSVAAVAVDGVTQPAASVAAASELFAPAQFRQMSDDEKLKAPSFEPMHAGVTWGSTAPRYGTPLAKTMTYEVLVFTGMDAPVSQPPKQTADAGAVTTVAPAGPAGLSRTRWSGRLKYAAPAFGPRVAEPRFVVATTSQLQKRADGDGTYTGAVEALSAFSAAHPADDVQIVRAEEVRA